MKNIINSEIGNAKIEKLLKIEREKKFNDQNKIENPFRIGK